MIEKYWSGVARNGCGHPGHKVNGWVNGWIELIFHADANSRKLRIIYFNNFWVAVVKNGHGTLNFNEWLNLAEFLHANIYSRKLKVTLTVTGWAWSNIGMSFSGFTTGVENMGGLKSIHGGRMGSLEMLPKNTCEGVHLIVKLLAISLQACKFT